MDLLTPPRSPRLRHLLYAVTNRVRWPECNYLVDPVHQFIYCPIAKVACSSMKLWFLDVVNDHPQMPFDEHEEVHRHSLRALPPVDALRLLRDRGYFTFAFVRNPWARLVSAFLNKFLTVNIVSQPVLRSMERLSDSPRPEATFREFVQFLTRGNPRRFDAHWRPQHLYLANNHFDFVGRFENLAADFAKVRQHLGIAAALPHFNSTAYADAGEEIVADWKPAELLSRKPFPEYQRFYTPELRDLVARIYADDVRMFGYEYAG